MAREGRGDLHRIFSHRGSHRLLREGPFGSFGPERRQRRLAFRQGGHRLFEHHYRKGQYRGDPLSPLDAKNGRKALKESYGILLDMHIAKHEWLSSHHEKALKRFERAFHAGQYPPRSGAHQGNDGFHDLFPFLAGPFPGRHRGIREVLAGR